jgi:hypothetical protein
MEKTSKKEHFSVPFSPTQEFEAEPIKEENCAGI